MKNRIYCGNTVNFSTYTKSYKLKKTLKNEPENMLIFENTHEDDIVLRYLRQVVSYARNKSDEFYAMAMANGEAEAKKQIKDNEKLRSEYETKISQLDNAIQLLFMDRSNGKITDERYDILSANFEKEQYEKAVKHSRTCGNRVEIYFTFSADKAIAIDRVITKNGDILIL